MSSRSTKGLEIYISKASASPTDVSPTAITKANPAEVTATTTGIVDGDLVTFSGTGLESLDGKTFPVTNVTATTFDVVGGDTSNDTGTFSSSTAKADHYAKGDLVKLCLASLTINADEPSVISTATYCNPTASVPSQVVSAGTLGFTGYVDINAADYPELLEAVEDGLPRVMRITLPSNGYLIAPITLSSMTYDLPIDGAQGYSGTAVLGSKMVHRY